LLELATSRGLFGRGASLWCYHHWVERAAKSIHGAVSGLVGKEQKLVLDCQRFGATKLRTSNEAALWLGCVQRGPFVFVVAGDEHQSGQNQGGYSAGHTMIDALVKK
jgi:hypothetical protein